MAKKGSNPGAKAQYAAYKAKDSATKNKTRKLLKHLKKHPNDAQALEAQKKGVGYRRKNPIAKNGWVTEEVRDFVKKYTLVFQDFTLSYKELSTMGKENSMKVAQAVKLMKKAAKLPPVFNKGKVTAYYLNKFNKA